MIQIQTNFIILNLIHNQNENYWSKSHGLRECSSDRLRNRRYDSMNFTVCVGIGCLLVLVMIGLIILLRHDSLKSENFDLYSKN